MLLNNTHDPQKRPMHQVVGLVLVIPLLISFVKLPLLMSPIAAIAAVLGSAYGAHLARQQNSHKLVVFAWTMAILNALSVIAMSTPSAAMGLYFLARHEWQAMAT
ncbi:hypothetical protein [Pseudomonas sp.]|uniref:hypothetical protein n=1 Tax=Pseudomonas sp. TaxID=306 RepID=UPI003D6FE36C